MTNIDIAELRRRWTTPPSHFFGVSVIRVKEALSLLDEIERLRECNAGLHMMREKCLQEHDGEIERLRAQLRGCDWHEEYLRAEDRIEKLEAALRKIADCPNIRCTFCEHNAREALEKTT